LRNIGNEGVVGAIMRLSRVFQRLCTKTINLATKIQQMEDVEETLSILEKELWPLFFDIMVHLAIHLVKELFICGPMCTRWMYPYEKYFKGLKGSVKNLAKVEGTIA